MEDLSERAIRSNCPHCDPTSQAFKFPLKVTENFYVVCDAHSIVEGHILIIPKAHLSCIAIYPPNLFEEFTQLNDEVFYFLRGKYGSVSSFEHGIFGQTVYHSHIHYMPFNGKPTDIVPEGKHQITKIRDLNKLKNFFNRDGGYLYFSIDDNLWVVDVHLAAPRFFRDRFAVALGRPERANWKKMSVDRKLTKIGMEDNIRTQKQWTEYFKK